MHLLSQDSNGVIYSGFACKGDKQINKDKSRIAELEIIRKS